MLTSRQLQMHLFMQEGLIPSQGAIILGQNYRCPTEEYFFGEFAQALQRNLVGLGADKYIKGRNVCFHFALFAKVLSHLCYLETPEAGEDTLAVGVLGFDPAQTKEWDGHVIAFAVIEIGGNLYTRYLEPQLPPHQITLTDQDKMNAAFYLI